MTEQTKTKHLFKKTDLIIPAVFIGAIIGSFLISSVLTPPAVHEIKELSTVGQPSIAVAAINDVNMGTLTKGTDFFGMSSHQVKVTTNSPDGYTVAISTKTTEQALTSTTSTDTIAASAGTLTSPAALADDTWGFALAGAHGFDNDYASATANSKWAGVPAAATTIVDKNTSATAGETTDVYFGVKVSSNIAVGTYKNTVVYTVISKLPDTIPAPTIESVTPAQGPADGGTEITIVGTNFTRGGESITTNILIDGQVCANPTILADTPTAGKDTIKCTVPSHNPGRVDATVQTWGGEATGDYTYIPSEIIYVTPDIANTTPGNDSGPAFTIVGTGFTLASDPVVDVKIGDNSCEAYTIVSNTHIVCTKGPNSGLTTGAKKVVVYHQSGAISGGNINVTYDNNTYPEFGTALATACTTTRTIARDSRDSQLYYIRRMADGKCWMTDNLKYNGGELAQVSGKALTISGATNNLDGPNNDVAKYVDPDAQSYCRGTTNMPMQTVTRCGFLYNWYAATAGSGNSTVNQSGMQATASICPAGMRLPSSLAGTTGPTADTEVLDFYLTQYGLRAEYSKTADYPVLLTSENAGTLTEGTTIETTQHFLGKVDPASNWAGVYAGAWGTNFIQAGSNGYYWTTTAASKSMANIERYRANAFYLNRSANRVFTGDGSYNDNRYYAFSVRCVGE